MKRYLTADRDKDRAEKGGYRSSGRGHGGQAYYHNPPPIREPRDKDDRDYGYEYTNRKEQAYRDTAPRPRVRRESDTGVRERPHSITDLDDIQRQSVHYRESGPPVSTRGFSKIQQDGTVRHEYHYPRDGDQGPRESSLVRGKNDGRIEEPPRISTRAPVSLHQDDGYGSNLEDRNHEKHRRHTRRTGSLERGADRGLGIRYQENDQRRADEKSRRHRDSFRSDSQERYSRASRHAREDSQDRYKYSDSGRRWDRDEHGDRERRRAEEHGRDKHGSSRMGETAALGAVGAATAAGLAAETSKHRRNKDGSDFDAEKSPREKSHRDGRTAAVLDPSEASGRSEELETDEDRRERRRRRRREREERERLGRGDALTVAAADVVSDSYERSSKYSRDPQVEEEESKSSRRRRHRRTKSGQQSDSEESSDERPGREYRPSQLRVVSPPKEPEVKPKGILRPPRDKFPEDPAPVREGVAPLKDAGKKGIPPNARWTKIDRRLVNPEALEQGNERYEERVDYVIVLRVLTKEDIEKYAELTQRLRGKSLHHTIQPDHALSPIPVDARSRDSKQKRLQIEAPGDHRDEDNIDDDAPARRLDSRPYNDEPEPRDHHPDRPAPQPLHPATNASMPALSAGADDAERPELGHTGSYQRPAPPSMAPGGAPVPLAYAPPPQSTTVPPAQGGVYGYPPRPPPGQGAGMQYPPAPGQGVQFAQQPPPPPQ